MRPLLNKAIILLQVFLVNIFLRKSPHRGIMTCTSVSHMVFCSRGQEMPVICPVSLLKEKGENMQEHTQHPCDSFLQQWNLRREVANYYFTALMRLSPDAIKSIVHKNSNGRGEGKYLLSLLVSPPGH